MTLAAAITAAMAAGLLGSLHCAAMCGPLALGGCARDGRVDARAAAGYFGGRLLSYAAVGAVMGTIGRHALCVLPVATIQRGAVIAVAAALAWRGVRLLRPAAPRPGGPRASGPRAATVPLGVKRPSLLVRAYRRLPRRGLGLGLATGLLPCGMLIPAWLLAAATGGAAKGAAVMLAFAVASAPGLLVPLAGRRALAGVLPRLSARAHGVAWCALAVWVALRPLLASVHHH